MPRFTLANILKNPDAVYIINGVVQQFHLTDQNISICPLVEEPIVDTLEEIYDDKCEEPIVDTLEKIYDDKCEESIIGTLEEIDDDNYEVFIAKYPYLKQYEQLNAEQIVEPVQEK